MLAAQHEIESLQKLIGSLRKKYYDCNDTIHDIKRCHVEDRAKKLLEENGTKDAGKAEPTVETTEQSNTDPWAVTEDIDWAEDPMN